MDEKKLKVMQEIFNTFEKNDHIESIEDVSDGYHSFKELYLHRAILSALVFNNVIPFAWKSKKHKDGTMYDGMFVVGGITPWGMITYHYDMEFWGMFNVSELPNAPEYDGYTPDDVIERLMSFNNITTNRLTDNDIKDFKAKIKLIALDKIYPELSDDDKKSFLEVVSKY